MIFIFESQIEHFRSSLGTDAQVYLKDENVVKELQTLEGGCRCGAIRYRISGAPSYVGNCHCDDCRRATGGPSVPWVGAHPENFAVTRGRLKEYESSPGVYRGFCATCGSPLSFRGDGWDDIALTVASLDDPNSVTPDSNVYLREKLHWVLINEDWRNYDGLP